MRDVAIVQKWCKPSIVKPVVNNGSIIMELLITVTISIMMGAISRPMSASSLPYVRMATCAEKLSQQACRQAVSVNVGRKMTTSAACI
jgi:hypothetical protein